MRCCCLVKHGPYSKGLDMCLQAQFQFVTIWDMVSDCFGDVTCMLPVHAVVHMLAVCHMPFDRTLLAGLTALDVRQGRSCVLCCGAKRRWDDGAHMLHPPAAC